MSANRTIAGAIFVLVAVAVLWLFTSSGPSAPTPTTPTSKAASTSSGADLGSDAAGTAPVAARTNRPTIPLPVQGSRRW